MERKIICITGGIGSGKSTVCSLLEQRGYPVYYSDARAKALMVEQDQLVQAIKDLFGSDAYEQGTLNRSYLADQIFKSPLLKGELEKLVHPAVRLDFDQWLQHQNSRLIFKESALAIEVNDATCELKVSVVADRKLRIARILSRNTDWSLEDVIARMSNQITDKQRISSSDEIIYNNGDYQDLKQAVDQLLDKVNII